MTIEQMLAAQRERVSFHMPGHKMRRGAETEFDTTELPNTDDLHDPGGPYLALGKRLVRAFGAGVSFPLVGGSTRGVQLMVLARCGPGRRCLPRNAHLSAWSACALGGVEAVPIPLRYDEQNEIPYFEEADVLACMAAHPEAGAILLTRGLLWPPAGHRGDRPRGARARHEGAGRRGARRHSPSWAWNPPARLARTSGRRACTRRCPRSRPALLHARDPRCERRSGACIGCWRAQPVLAPAALDRAVPGRDGGRGTATSCGWRRPARASGRRCGRTRALRGRGSSAPRIPRIPRAWSWTCAARACPARRRPRACGPRAWTWRWRTIGASCACPRSRPARRTLRRCARRCRRSRAGRRSRRASRSSCAARARAACARRARRRALRPDGARGGRHRGLEHRHLSAGRAPVHAGGARHRGGRGGAARGAGAGKRSSAQTGRGNCHGGKTI